MQLNIITSLLSLFAVSTHAAAIEQRVPLLGGFGVSQIAGCPLQQQLVFQVAIGDGCGDCRTFYNGTIMKSINVYSMNPQCVVTVHQKLDCTDPGIQSGTGGCWTPEGGIAAYTVSCPWWSPNNYFPACSH
ncbi:hypothetical protein B0H66DRAFT_270256 [Apodospora peruviana]|uniref:Uncharacterized protein n=1 Tax=Apodospora peruviana TaxID=516989 RepID=A0AAE0M1V3_9PEZI|nr:hypothetical protein B0H66DRAFT_270256 [Apodospora peruviana]